MSEAELALKRFQKEPELFFTKVLGVERIEDYQRRILQTVATRDRIAIRACHDVGKSWAFARLVLWFGSCFPYSKIITTAPTFNQVQNILWAEIRSAFAASKFPLGGKMNLTEWQVTREGNWFAIGFTPKNELSQEGGQGQQSNFQGFHAPHIMVLFDEATGVHNRIWSMAEGMLTSANVKFLTIGNPTSRMSDFYKCFSSPDWAKISLTCFDSPNLIANEITNVVELKREIDLVASLSDNDAAERMASYKQPVPYLITLKWVVGQGLPRKWGIDHPLFKSKVLGEFPGDEDGALIPLGAVESAQLRVYFPVDGDRKTLGVDVARFGSDASVMTALHGKRHLFNRSYTKKSVAELAGILIAELKETSYDIVVIDETGIGGGVVDLLNEAKSQSLIPESTEIRGVQFGGVAGEDEDKEKFVNIKARMFKLLADDIKDERGLTLGSDAVYLDELPTILYSYDSKGRMAIESKEAYKKRTGRASPDHADSLALANFGRYDAIGVGRMSDAFLLPEADERFPRPFADSLGGPRPW